MAVVHGENLAKEALTRQVWQDSSPFGAVCYHVSDQAGDQIASFHALDEWTSDALMHRIFRAWQMSQDLFSRGPNA